MSSVFAPGSDVVLTFDFVDLNGDAVTPTELNLVVTNEEDVEVHSASVAIPEGSPTSVTVTIPASANTITGSVGAREAVLEMTVGSGVVPVKLHYVLRGSTVLVTPTNTFQTYKKALVTAATMPGLTSWALATESDRIAALLLAYNRLTRFNYRIWRPEEDDEQNRLVSEWDNIITPRMWPLMTGVEFNAYGAHFLEALRKAQVAEADAILSGNEAHAKRSDGILSETIGESSMVFRSGKGIERTVSREAHRYLASFIPRRSLQIGRA